HHRYSDGADQDLEGFRGRHLGFDVNCRSKMHVLKANGNFAGNGRKQDGFSVLEMIVASAILMGGIVSVVQLVPASLKNSVGNRMDTMATVIAQRELDQMLSRPLNLPPTFLDKDGNFVSLDGTNGSGAAV